MPVRRARSISAAALGASLIAAGALSAVSGASIVSGSAALHAVLTVTPRTVQIDQPVVADVHQSTLRSGTTLKKVTVWGDGKATVLTSLKQTPAHRFARTGRFNVREVLTDSTGKSSSASVAEVVVPVQHVFWDLFYGRSLMHQLEYTTAPLAGTSKYTDVAGTAGNRLRCTSGMTTDAKGRLFVLSYPSGCSAPDTATIEVFNMPVHPSSTPAHTLTLPGTGDDDLLVFDRAGNLWVEDGYSSIIYKFRGPFTTSKTLVPVLTLSTGKVRPSGLAVDRRGDLFVANLLSKNAKSIAVYHAPVSASTVPTYLYGLTEPGGLTFDAQGNLYAFTTRANAPALVRYNSNHLGSGALPNIEDTAGLAGKMPYAASFAWDASGNLYMADCGQHAAIRKYPLAFIAFSAHLAPIESYTNASLKSVGCVWGIAIH
jgi:sugar lactone lactonase YvrE